MGRSTVLRSKLFRGFGDPSRLSVLECLLDGPKCVSEIVAATGLSQPNASLHLACLRDCGLVEREARGRFAYYRLAGPHVRHIIACADAILGLVGPLIEACPRYGDDTQEEIHSSLAARHAGRD